MTNREMQLKLNPQVNLSRPTTARMWLVFCCASVVMIQSSISDAGTSAAVAAAALVSALMTELLMTSTRYGLGKIKDGSAAASAMVLALLLPNGIHPVYAALGAAFAMAVVKHSFGGLGSNWMNPALGGWLFIRFSWPQTFARAINPEAPLLSETPLPLEAMLPTGSAADEGIRTYLNKTVFMFFGAELPPGYIDLFSLQSPGIIADRAVLSLILVTVVISACNISRSWLSVLYLAVFGFLVRMTGDLPSGGAWWNGDVLLALFSGGTLVTAFILIVDPSSGAKSVQGNVILVILAAVLSLIFRVFASAFYGGFFAVALVNALTPLVCRVERYLLYSTPPKESLSAVFREGAAFKGGAASRGGAVSRGGAAFKEGAASKGGVR